MRKRPALLWIAAVAVAAALYLCIGIGSARRVIGRTANHDGTSTVAFGQPRLFGMLGIEISFGVVDRNGTVLFSTGVKDSCRSWSEARRKYSAPIALAAPAITIKKEK